MTKEIIYQDLQKYSPPTKKTAVRTTTTLTFGENSVKQIYKNMLPRTNQDELEEKRRCVKLLRSTN